MSFHFNLFQSRNQHATLRLTAIIAWNGNWIAVQCAESEWKKETNRDKALSYCNINLCEGVELLCQLIELNFKVVGIDLEFAANASVSAV